MPVMCVGTDEDDEEGPLSTSLTTTGPGAAIAHDEEDEEDEEEDEEDAAGSSPKPPSAPKPPATLRVIFLNLDGVLNTRPDPRLIFLEGAPCSILRRLLEASGATLVLSTPWRRHHQYIGQALANFGVFGDEATGPLAELERTPFNADGTRRDLEVLQWVRQKRLELAGWVAIDSTDLLKFPSATHLEGHFVRTSAETGGLGVTEVKAALEMLGCAEAARHFAAGAPAPPPAPPTSEAAPRTAGFHPAARAGGPGAAAAAAVAPSPAALRGGGAQGVSGRDEDIFRTAAAWDDQLAEKMEALLAALGPMTSSYSDAAPGGIAGRRQQAPTASAAPAATAAPVAVATTSLAAAAGAADPAAGAPAGPDEFDELDRAARERFAR